MSISGVGGLSNYDHWRLDNGVRLMPDKVTDAIHTLRELLKEALRGEKESWFSIYECERDDGGLIAEVNLSLMVDDADPHELGLMLIELGRKLT